jgi:hypothetical protein
MLRTPVFTCSFMYYFNKLTRDITNNDNSTYILGHGDIYNEQFKQNIGSMMYSQCLHDLNVTDNLHARTTITAIFNDKDSITLHYLHDVSVLGEAPNGSIIQGTVLHGRGKYGKVNPIDYKTTALIRNGQRHIRVEPK